MELFINLTGSQFFMVNEQLIKLSRDCFKLQGYADYHFETWAISKIYFQRDYRPRNLVAGRCNRTCCKVNQQERRYSFYKQKKNRKLFESKSNTPKKFLSRTTLEEKFNWKLHLTKTTRERKANQYTDTPQYDGQSNIRRICFVG